MSFDKYEYYSKAVQSSEHDVHFLTKAFQDTTGRKPLLLREDFCGTFKLCEEWVKLSPQHRAHGVDLDSEPVNYGKNRVQKSLKAEQQERLQIHLQNVLDEKVPTAELVVAMNFSYFIFKQRQELKLYFSQVFKKLAKDGVFVIDTFGGSDSYESHVEKTRHPGFTYYWDQKNYEPLTNGAKFEIHFQLKNEKRRRLKQFTYDWRMWTIPELRDILNEVGFSNVVVYWEGTTRKGEGNNIFKPATKGEECQSWIAYLVCSR